MVKQFKLDKYKAITISGRVASGATTLSLGLSEKLSWQLWSGGEIYRQYAKDNGIPLEKTHLSTDEYHLKLDEHIKEKLKTESNLIIESWLAGFDAQGIKSVYKIMVTCPDDSVRVDRLVNRDKMTIEEAKIHLTVREEENLKKWERLYHTRDYWNPKLYDLVIDTYANGPTEALDIALKEIGFN